MAKQKYLERIKELFEKSVVVTFSDIDKIINNKKKRNTDYAKQLLNRLVAKEKIKKLTKGFYTSHDESSLSVLCFKPAYLGLQSALSFHGLWEQETNPVIITSNSVRQGIRECLGANIIVRRADKKYLFGYEYSEDAGYYLPYSDIEKTLIDFIVFREKISPEVLAEFKKRINKKKLEKYLKVYPKVMKIKVNNALINSLKVD